MLLRHEFQKEINESNLMAMPRVERFAYDQNVNRFFGSIRKYLRHAAQLNESSVLKRGRTRKRESFIPSFSDSSSSYAHIPSLNFIALQKKR